MSLCKYLKDDPGTESTISGSRDRSRCMKARPVTLHAKKKGSPETYLFNGVSYPTMEEEKRGSGEAGSKGRQHGARPLQPT